jgi:hypothetical protein
VRLALAVRAESGLAQLPQLGTLPLTEANVETVLDEARRPGTGGVA